MNSAAEPITQPHGGGQAKPSRPVLSAVLITMGTRPEELKRSINSILNQAEPPSEIILVGNGVEVPGLPSEVTQIPLAENIGIPAGRNRGSDAARGDVLVFVDDDGWLADDHVFSHLREEFAAQPDLGIVSFQVADPDGGPGFRRHVPRLRAGDPQRSSDVTTFLGTAYALRKEVLEQCGGLPDVFFYGHEETDLAWRALDHGWRIRYDAQAKIFHPAVLPTRHDLFYRMNARNRVLIARRNLPWILVPFYLGSWTAITVVRVRKVQPLKVWFKGFAEGWRMDPGPRRPMKWKTVVRMTRLGRPPVI